MNILVAINCSLFNNLTINFHFLLFILRAPSSLGEGKFMGISLLSLSDKTECEQKIDLLIWNIG